MHPSHSCRWLLCVAGLASAVSSAPAQGPLQTNAFSSIRVTFAPSGPATITGGTFWHYNHAWFDGAVAPDTGAVDPADQPAGFGMFRYEGLDGQRRIINNGPGGPVLVNRRRTDYAAGAFPATDGSSISAGDGRRISAGDGLDFDSRPWDPPGTLISAALSGSTDIHTDDSDPGTVAHAFARPEFDLNGVGDGWRQGSLTVDFTAGVTRNTRHPDCAASLDVMASLTVRGLDDQGAEMWSERLFDLRLFETIIDTQFSGFGFWYVQSDESRFSEDLASGFLDVDMTSPFISPEDRGRFLGYPSAVIADGVFAGIGGVGFFPTRLTFDYNLPFAASYQFALEAGVPAPGSGGVLLLGIAATCRRSRRETRS